MTETAIVQRIRLAATRIGARLFRNQRGKHRLENGRWIETGLAPGASDLIGWIEVEVTPAMVGRKVAVFAAVEVKASRGKPTEAQMDWVGAVRRAGGVGVVAWSEREAIEAIEEWGR